MNTTLGPYGGSGFKYTLEPKEIKVQRKKNVILKPRLKLFFVSTNKHQDPFGNLIFNGLQHLVSILQNFNSLSPILRTNRLHRFNLKSIFKQVKYLGARPEPQWVECFTVPNSMDKFLVCLANMKKLFGTNTLAYLSGGREKRLLFRQTLVANFIKLFTVVTTSLSA